MGAGPLPQFAANSRNTASHRGAQLLPPHIYALVDATYASLRTARVTLGDAEMRSKYDERERIKAREYAEDVDDDNTYLGAARRKVFGVIYYGIYGGIVAQGTATR